MSSGAYSFLPWLRTGLSTKIKDDPGNASRASVLVQLRLTGEPLEPKQPPPSRLVKQPVQLYGPGDVIGIDPRAISRTEPQPFISNFEPNYLAHIEFYQEDIPWRYSPAPRDIRRLKPWLALIVLAVPEFEDGTLPDRPLPYITVKNPGALQNPHDLGAWAHVHVNGELDSRLAVDDPENMGTALANLGRVLRKAPDSACSRIVCPRHLLPSTTYHAFLVPAFETGRRAGIGLAPKDIPALTPSWGVAQTEATGQLPYYHRWSFTTSTAGDFEYLVRLLKPIEAKDPIGRRDMDAHRSDGFGLPPLTTPTLPDGVLRLGGALQLPEADEHPDAYENWDDYYGEPGPPRYPNQWQKSLAGLINLAEAYKRTPPAAVNAEHLSTVDAPVDPVITPPLYGRWHSLTPELLADGKGGPAPEAELRGWVHRLNLDPRFRVAAHFGTKVIQARQEELMAAAWNQLGDVQRANARIRAAQLAREIGNRLQDKHFPSPAPVPALATDGPPPLASARALILAAPATARVVERKPATRDAEVTEQLAVGYKVARSRVAAAPVSPAMRRITRPGSRLMRTLRFPAGEADRLVSRIDEGQISAAGQPATPAGLLTVGRFAAPPEVAGSERYLQALRQLDEHWSTAAAAAVDERPKLGITEATGDMMAGLDAEKTMVATLLDAMNLPDRLKPSGELTEVMAYPAFDMPMYRDLLTMSVDTFVPNLGLLPPNSITLLENNRKFIESYLIGLNHEMARELLWREYPTDSRGTPFRQFWDPRAVLPVPNETPAQRRERLYDIKPLHQVPKTALLGENDNRQQAPVPGEDQKNDLVLVIRGELLKKYPTAAIYAHKAVWPRNRDGSEDKSGERVLAEFPPNLPPPPELVKLPIYEAKVEPDIYLLGFDLDADSARGQHGDLGWFFVIKERPGDPRFGLDDDQPGVETRVEVWNDLTWGKVDPSGHRFIEFDQGVRVGLDDFNHDEDDQEKTEQRADDVQITAWEPTVSSADVAYILFQAPVLVAVHAQEMLRDVRPQP
ncbi:hypothetical protein D5S17_05505 [Pseudonocardiaceae bacterium YIM PH 21723]|nr:hypothetical protein D5S17_05505 [Pseudonocardiaceae bacterium YIM PH 21723]